MAHRHDAPGAGAETSGRFPDGTPDQYYQALFPAQPTPAFEEPAELELLWGALGRIRRGWPAARRADAAPGR